MTYGLDIIGDVHGHAQRLVKLLGKLGYKHIDGCFRHGERKAVFLGDLIDRGPENFATLRLVKSMVERDQATIILGNHELNALAYHTRNGKGEFLRPHTIKNRAQHEAVLEEIGQGNCHEWQEFLEWFRKMPLFIETRGIRIVHACWDRKAIDFFREREKDIRDHQGRMTDAFLSQATQPGNPTFDAIEILLKGKEIWLPRGHNGIPDKDGNLRKKVRIKWWLTQKERKQIKTYDAAARAKPDTLRKLADIEVPGKILSEIQDDESCIPDPCCPVFVGHYWFTGAPTLLTPTAACLDYSVARGGKLVCYRWDGEEILDNRKFTWI